MTETEAKWPAVREELYQAIKGIMDLDLTMEICGAWIWLEGDTKYHQQRLIKAGFKWAPNKRKWFFKPRCLLDKHQGKHMSMEKIRLTYGSKHWF